MTDLKPCPFCGGEKVSGPIFLDEDAPSWMVWCEMCNCSARVHGATESAAAQGWNRRASGWMDVDAAQLVEGNRYELARSEGTATWFDNEEMVGGLTRRSLTSS